MALSVDDLKAKLQYAQKEASSLGVNLVKELRRVEMRQTAFQKDFREARKFEPVLKSQRKSTLADASAFGRSQKVVQRHSPKHSPIRHTVGLTPVLSPRIASPQKHAGNRVSPRLSAQLRQLKHLSKKTTSRAKFDLSPNRNSGSRSVSARRTVSVGAGAHSRSASAYRARSPVTRARSPGSRRISPRSHAINPRSNGLSPGSHGVSLGSNAISPASHALSPGSYGLSCSSHAMSSATHTLSPGSHNAIPHDHRPLSPVTHARSMPQGMAHQHAYASHTVQGHPITRASTCSVQGDPIAASSSQATVQARLSGPAPPIIQGIPVQVASAPSPYPHPMACASPNPYGAQYHPWRWSGGANPTHREDPNQGGDTNATPYQGSCSGTSYQRGVADPNSYQGGDANPTSYQGTGTSGGLNQGGDTNATPYQGGDTNATPNQGDGVRTPSAPRNVSTPQESRSSCCPTDAICTTKKKLLNELVADIRGLVHSRRARNSEMPLDQSRASAASGGSLYDILNRKKDELRKDVLRARLDREKEEIRRSGSTPSERKGSSSPLRRFADLNSERGSPRRNGDRMTTKDVPRNDDGDKVAEAIHMLKNEMGAMREQLTQSQMRESVSPLPRRSINSGVAEEEYDASIRALQEDAARMQEVAARMAAQLREGASPRHGRDGVSTSMVPEGMVANLPTARCQDDSEDVVEIREQLACLRSEINHTMTLVADSELGDIKEELHKLRGEVLVTSHLVEDTCAHQKTDSPQQNTEDVSRNRQPAREQQQPSYSQYESVRESTHPPEIPSVDNRAPPYAETTPYPYPHPSHLSSSAPYPYRGSHLSESAPNLSESALYPYASHPSAGPYSQHPWHLSPSASHPANPAIAFGHLSQSAPYNAAYDGGQWQQYDPHAPCAPELVSPAGWIAPDQMRPGEWMVPDQMSASELHPAPYPAQWAPEQLNPADHPECIPPGQLPTEWTPPEHLQPAGWVPPEHVQPAEWRPSWEDQYAHGEWQGDARPQLYEQYQDASPSRPHFVRDCVNFAPHLKASSLPPFDRESFVGMNGVRSGSPEMEDGNISPPCPRAKVPDADTVHRLLPPRLD